MNEAYTIQLKDSKMINEASFHKVTPQDLIESGKDKLYKT